MAERIKSTFRRVVGFFQGMEKKKLILLAALAAVVITTGIVGAVLLNRVTYTALYSGLSAEEAGEVMTLLQEKGVAAKAEGTDTILVPEEQADELRIELASQGYPSTGLNYDLFANAGAIGATDLERQTYLQYQLQENMRATISRMEKVEDCVVIVNLASSSSFVLSDNTSPASVAVLLSVKDGAKLSQAEAKTIGAFVLKCVPKLRPENISIVDSRMNTYDILSDDEAQETAGFSDTQRQLTEEMKQILTEQALRVLEPAVGDGNVAISVNLSLDFDKKTVSSVEFSPPVEGETKGLLRSSEELHDTVNGGGAAGAGGQAGTDSNGVSAPEYVADSGADQNSESSSNTYNYELNEIRTQLEKAQGSVQDLSVAVLLNSDVNGIGDHLDTVKNLVAGAIGVDARYVSAEVMPFVQQPGAMGFDDYFSRNQETLRELSRNSLIRTIVLAASVPLAAALAVWLLHRSKKRDSEELDEAAMAAAVSPEMLAAEQESLLQELVIQKSNEAERVEELMDKYPETAVQILRTWLAEER